MDELEKVRASMKQKKKRISISKENSKSKKSFWMIRLFFTVIITVLLILVLQNNSSLKQQFYQKVLENNFSFARFNEFYKEHFGSSIPFQNLLKEPVKTTFRETLVYSNVEKYKDGAALTVKENYLVPVKKSGLVVFKGEKEGYGNVVIVQQMDGIDLWYGNLSEINVNLYDYVEEGSLLGEVKDKKLYLVFKKEGEVLDYQKYLEEN